MMGEWVRRHPPSGRFLSGPGIDLTYGQLRASAPDVEDDLVVAPSGPAQVAELLTALAAGRRVVLVDPSLPPAEEDRRRQVARSARGQEAATIVFTSGTTGPAKGVRLTWRNWEAAAEASARHLDHQPDDVWLAVMPLHHVGGLSVLLRSAFVGGSVAWLPRFDVDAVVARLRGQVTMASLVPTMLRRVLDRDGGEYRGLKAVLVGGGPIPGGLLEEAHARGIPALPTYGMTETCAQVATLEPGSAPRPAAHPLPGVDLRIGSGGRIEVRSRQVSPGYAGDGDREPGTWFRTPDRGRLDDDGAVRVLGRADDVIVTGGENVDPATVEQVLISHPAVTDAVVAGVEDPEWGMRVVAVYSGDVGAETLGRWASEHLAPHEVPRALAQVETVPSPLNGKPDRRRVARHFA